MTQKLSLDHALDSLLACVKSKHFHLSYTVNKNIFVEMRVMQVDGVKKMYLFVHFNLKNYTGKKSLVADLKKYVDFNPTTEYKIETIYYSYVDNNKMCLLDISQDPKFKYLIASWQNLTKSKSEFRAEESASSNQKSCQTLKNKQTE